MRIETLRSKSVEHLRANRPPFGSCELQNYFQYFLPLNILEAVSSTKYGYIL